MKALTYIQAHSLDHFSIKETEVKTPAPEANDVIVKLKAIGFNPVDYKIRKNRSGNENVPVILGWDASGVIESVGANVQGFKTGDEVYYAGDLTRNGSYAEMQAVDYRLIAKKPKSLSFTQAAALPLTTITAYEALILQSTTKLTKETTVLVIGGAGGVGSMAIQLLKNLTPVKIVATASRLESIDWCKKLGAHEVINHNNNLKEELTKIGIKEVDFVFSTNHTEKYFTTLLEIVRPFGHITLIDDPTTLDIKPTKQKSISVNFEFMFTRSMFQFEPEKQGKLLEHVASLVDEGKIKTTMNQTLKGLSAANVKLAHENLESGTNIGKIVLEL